MKWPTLALEDLATVQRGKFSARPRNDPKYYGGDIPFIQTGDVANGAGRVRSYSQTLNSSGLSVSKLFPKGSLVVTIAANIGDVAKVEFDFACPDSLVVVQANQAVNSDWLQYSLESKKALLDSLAPQNAQKNINLEVLRPLAFDVPPFGEQQRIAGVINAWDGAIEKTERLVVLRMKQKAWLLSRVISASGSTTKLGDFIKQVSRPMPKPTQPYWALGIRSHGKGTFQRFVADPNSVDMEELYALERDNLIVNITFAWEGAIAFVKPEDERCLVSHRFPTYEIDREIADPGFVKYIVNCKPFFSQLALISPGGAGRNRVLNKKDFLKLSVSLPPRGEQKRYAQILATMDLLLKKETSQLASLKKQKRGLMQKLLTGQWRVKIAETEAG